MNKNNIAPLELAEKYMDIVFDGKDIQKLLKILSDDFTFEGPLYKFGSPKEYVQSLLSDPPKNFRYTIIESFETDSSACIIYQFSKQSLTVPMAQFFEIEGNKIKKILLIFDSIYFRKQKIKNE